MELWIPITIAAALAQAIRFGLQKQLKATSLTAVGATFARFLYSAPIVVVAAWAYTRISGQGWPGMPPAFWVYALSAGVAQILATVCVVALFGLRNFAVGVALIKTEVLLSVLVGLIVLGEGVNFGGMVAIFVGVVAVFLLSDPPDAEGLWYLRIANKGAALGLGAGLLFAYSAVGYRAATLEVASGGPLLRGITTLACVTTFQLAIMAVWLVVRDRGEIARVLSAWRIAGLVGLTSLVGSLGWFTAFAMQTAAYVKALGQIELAFVVLGSMLFFKERLTPREVAGLVLVTISVILLVLLV